MNVRPWCWETARLGGRSRLSERNTQFTVLSLEEALGGVGTEVNDDLHASR